MKKIAVIGLALLLSACSTSYQPYSFMTGGGYKDAQLSENSFKVTFEANGYTNKTQAADLALLRAAQLTMQHGFKYFVIVANSDNGQGMVYTTPTTTTMSASGYGNTARGSAQSYGGQSFMIDFPAPSITIMSFADKPNLNGMVYDAAIVEQSMKAQYNIK